MPCSNRFIAFITVDVHHYVQIYLQYQQKTVADLLHNQTAVLQ